MINDIERALSALNHLDAGCSREEWVRIGMAAKSTGLSFEDFHSWSQDAHNYVSEKDCRVAWSSFKTMGSITGATLFYMAALFGWDDPKRVAHDKKVIPNCKIVQDRTPNSIDNREENIPNKKATKIWNDCIPATGQFTYICRKFGKPAGLKVYGYHAPELIICGQNVHGYLVVPCWSDGNLKTLQFIPPWNGEKLNLSGASFGEGYFLIGQIKDKIYVCEGLGQAWAINMIDNSAAVVCFGAGRMMTVAKKLRLEYPRLTLIIVPDRGKEEKAIQVANVVNGLYVTMPEEKPINYDVNDYLQETDSEVLRSLLENCRDAKSSVSSSYLVSHISPFFSGCDASHGTNSTRPLTELGNAHRMLDTSIDTVKYIGDIKKWIVWSGLSWHWDDGSYVRSIVGKLPKIIYKEGSAYLGDSEKFAKWARKSQELRVINATITLLSDFPEARLSLSCIDANNFMVGFNQAKHVIDLQNGSVRLATPSDYIIKSLGAKTFGDARSALRWVQFLEQIFEGDYEVIEWIQRFCGYLLTGSTQEQIFLFCFGYGANGKSVFSELLKEVMGDYGTVIAWETLSESKRQAGSATPDLVTLIGKRFGVCSETEDNRVLAESLVKGVVSGDSMTVRPLYVAPIEFKPNCKLVITGNHKPIVKGNDNGIWRRVRLVPFNRTFLPEERDPQLLTKLKEEIPHILAWMVNGCLNWQRKGLAEVPKVIREATESYQLDQDIIGRWLGESTMADVSSEVATNDLYASYSQWCFKNGLKATSAVLLGRRLGERGFVGRQSNGKRYWKGLSLKSVSSCNEYAIVKDS